MRKITAIFLSLSLAIGPFLSLAQGYEMPADLLQASKQQEELPPQPVAQDENSDWTLVWSDEFEGGEGDNFHRGLDLRTWEIQTGNGATMGLSGWGNGEIQYYHGDNVWVEDGMLHIEARLENRGSPGEGNWRHTSGRIRSVGTEGIGTGMSVRYGRIEASISLPVGAGLWPAFWMMPTYDVYGTWAASGEIDIMEARGRDPFTSTSAIHYGGMWPNNTHSHGSLDLRTLDPNLTINDFIQYAVEWEPGEMRFLINDHVFWTVNDWHALVRGQEGIGTRYMFPAPFDQDFHILLNLAIGGWFDGGIEPDDSLFDEARLMRVEYVRVYELTGRPLREPNRPPLEPDPIPAEAKEMRVPGGQIWDSNFENIVRSAPLPGEAGFPTRDGWELFSGPFGGSISGYNVTDDTIHVQIAAAGGPVYANQLMQRVSLVRGRHYRLSFDARAAAPRTLNARLSQGANPGWIAYTNFNPNLTTETQRFSHYFTMTNPTNLDARLELNMGGSAHDIWFSNVVLEEVNYVPEGYQGVKAPLPCGNLVWNGTFNQGSDGLIFWSRAGDNFSVHHARHQLEVTNIPATAEPSDVMISQRRIPFANDTYRLAFDAVGTGALGFRVLNLAGDEIFYETIFNLNSELPRNVHEFTLSGIPHDMRELQIQFLFGNVEGEMVLDNVRIDRLTTNDRDFTGVRMHPLDNGDFFAGLRSWEHANDSGGAGATVINDGVATTSVTSLGINPWSVILMNNGLQVQSGFTYAVEFDASSTVNRNIQLVVETPAFARRLEPIVALTPTEQSHRFEFSAANTETLDLKFLMGAMDGAVLGDVNISNVRFYIVDAPLERIPTFVADATNNIAGSDITLRYHYESDPAFSSGSKTVTVNGEVVDFVHQAGEIIISGVNFPQAGTYRIGVAAAGYEAIVLSQLVREASPVERELLINGNFRDPMTGPEGGWWYAPQSSPLFTANWYAWFDASYRLPAEGGIAVDLVNAGYLEWHAFLHQDLESRLPVGNYELTFSARSTRARDIWVDFALYPSPLQQQATVSLTPVWQTFTINVESADLVRFLLGYVGGGAHNHTVYIENVRLEEVCTAELVELLADIAARGLVETNFTEESWSVFANALANAEAILASTRPSQAQINDAIDELQAALAGLERIFDGNFLINGNFEDPLTGPEGGWWYPAQNSPLFTANWYSWFDASYRLPAGGGIAVDLVNAGYLSWHAFLHQAFDRLPEGNYALTFSARSTRDRDIFVEFGTGAMQQQTAVSLTDEWKDVTIYVTSADFVRFLLGYDGGGAHNHTVYIQNVRLAEVVDTPPPTCPIEYTQLGVIISSPYAGLHYGPGSATRNLGNLDFSTKIHIGELNGNWIQACHDGIEGYVSRGRVDVIRIFDEPRSGFVNTAAGFHYGPGSAHEAINASLSPGTPIEILGIAQNGNWYYVRIGDELGFISRGRTIQVPPTTEFNEPRPAFISVYADFRQGPGSIHLPVLNPDEQIPPGTPIEILGVAANGNWYFVRIDGNYGYVSRGRTIQVGPTVRFDETLFGVIATAAHFNQGPGSIHLPVLDDTLLPVGTEVQILGIAANGNWSLVEVDGNVGYVSRGRIDFITMFDEPREGVVATAAGLHIGAGSAHPLVGGSINPLPVDTPVTILGVSQNGNWYYVRVGEANGFVSRGRVR